MKASRRYDGHVVIELTRRNLEILLKALDEGVSPPALTEPYRSATVVAVENEAHYSNRTPGRVFLNGEWV